jgi:hypothetical protein
MLAEGTYRGRPLRAALGRTGTGKEQLGVQFQLVDPPGERLTWYGYFTDGTFDRTIESLRSCGWAGSDLAEFQGDVLPQGFDQEVELVVKHEEYNGKVSARIAFINSGGGLAMKEALDATQARAFAARMKGRIVALDRSSGAPRQQQRRPASNGPPTPDEPPGGFDGGGDDIPF